MCPMVEEPAVPSAAVHTDLGYPGDGDGHSVAGVHLVTLHIQGQSVQGNPGERHGKACKGRDSY